LYYLWHLLDDLRKKALYANKNRSTNASNRDIATAKHKVRREDTIYLHEVCISVPEKYSQDKIALYKTEK
jgi:hypothetical protein